MNQNTTIYSDKIVMLYKYNTLSMKSIYEELRNTLSIIQETSAANIIRWTNKQSEELLELHNLLKKKPYPLAFQDRL